jgi:hypothetical protein
MRTRLIQMAFLNAFMAGIDLPGPWPLVVFVPVAAVLSLVFPISCSGSQPYRALRP